MCERRSQMTSDGLSADSHACCGKCRRHREPLNSVTLVESAVAPSESRELPADASTTPSAAT